jgi:hypothetical protein
MKLINGKTSPITRLIAFTDDGPIQRIDLIIGKGARLVQGMPAE